MPNTPIYFEVEALDPVTGDVDFAIVNAETACEAETYARFHYFTGHLVEATLIHPPMNFYGNAHRHV